LILFRSRSIPARIIRGLAGATYDHVGILFKQRHDASGYLIDATGKVGVAAINLTSFFTERNYNQFERIVWRKLYVYRDDEFYTKFVRFANRELGKKYKLTMKKLLNR
jgi:hypothetical protein